MPAGNRNPVNLTNLKVHALRPEKAGEYIQGDTQVPGFGVRVRPSGARTYVLRKRIPGDSQPTRITLGRVGEIGLGKAREDARQAIGAVRGGIDVNAAKRVETAARKSGRDQVSHARAATGFAPDTFGELAVRYLERECPRLARGAELAGVIRRELLPQLGNRPFAELRRRDLGAVVDAIADGGRPAAAHKVREIAKRIANWGNQEEFIDRNPFLGGKSPIRRRERTRVLADGEIAALWQAWRQMGAPFGAFMMLALATGQRRSEVAAIEASEVDLGRRLWTIPGDKAKNRKTHLVPLSGLAVEILQSVPALDDRYIFSTRADTRISGYSKAKARADRLSGISDWRIHDLRRTVATCLAEMGVSHPAVAALLNHSPRGALGVTSIYNRYQYLDERRAALERWAERLRELVMPSAKVLPLRAAGA